MTTDVHIFGEGKLKWWWTCAWYIKKCPRM